MRRTTFANSGVVKLLAVVFILLSTPLSSFIFTPAQASELSDIEILHTAVHPDTNITYHLLSEASWEDSADVAVSLGGFLVTIDNETEENWIFETFSFFNNQTRHLWIGLNDAANEGDFRWHDGTPFVYRNWGDGQPSQGGDEDYVHITGTNMGNIEPGTWNDLENDPQYFPVYGVVEIGPAADYSLQFDGDDYIEVEPISIESIQNEMTIMADVYPYTSEGTQFIFMNGDYGFGMYLANGYLAYADEYSLSKHPKANENQSMLIPTNQWSNVAVTITQGVGGGFYLNGELIHNISSNDAQIPLGDFGSNECYEQNRSCDEFVIGKMGAACDCNYFNGIIDNVVITSKDFGMDSGNQQENLSINYSQSSVASFGFNEGSGAFTISSEEYNGTINGASWVLPDGTIVAQVIELKTDEYIDLYDLKEGDIHLFYIEIPDFTKYLYFFGYSEFSWEWEGEYEENSFVVYTSENQMPTKWSYDYKIDDEWGYMSFEYEWPEPGQAWFMLEAMTDVEYITLGVSLIEGTPPPALEDMTELQESIPITSQSVRLSDDWSSNSAAKLHYYVNVTEDLADLRVQTYGGEGNVDLAISKYTVPDPFDEWYYWDEDIGIPGFYGENGQQNTEEDWSSSMGNDEEVHLFDVEPGIYYITAYTYRRASEFTIVADFTYPPTNVEPETAIQLTPGEKYGLISGYEGLYQYFKVDVPAGTERLVVDLNDGKGEASMYMRLDLPPTESEFDYHSTAPGANDKIAFNDPTPGTWFILLSTSSIFSGVNIIAEFEDRFVWDYDGTPIELFNGEPIDGIEIPESKYLDFIVKMDSNSRNFELNTYAGSGDVLLLAEGEQLIFERTGSNRVDNGIEEVEITPFTIRSENDGTNHNIYVELLPSGEVSIRMTAKSDLTDVSIVARWQEVDLPIDIVPDEEIFGNFSNCKDIVTEKFLSLDQSNDGSISGDELKNLDLNVYDANEDKVIDQQEYLHIECACANEVGYVVSSYDGTYNSNPGIPTSIVKNHTWLNDYSFDYYDNNDDYMNDEEFEIAKLLCKNTFNAFDRDGDGVNDVDDAFPSDPTESKDTDNDGVGDNADFAPKVANDMLYSFGGVIIFVLFGLLLVAMRKRSGQTEQEKWNDFDRLSEQFMGEEEDDFEQEIVEQNITSRIDAPPKDLMGMVNLGIESLEYPSSSGIIWVRSEYGEDWVLKD